MNSDSLTPKLPPESTLSQVNPENSQLAGMEDNSQILPDEEVANVLNFLERHESSEDANPHFISSLVNTPVESPKSEQTNHPASRQKLHPKTQGIPNNTITPSINSQSQPARIEDTDNTNSISVNLANSNDSENTPVEVTNSTNPVDGSQPELKEEKNIANPPIEPASTIPPQPTPISNQSEKKEVTPTANPSVASPESFTDTLPEIHPLLQVQLKSEGGRLQVILPSEAQLASSKYSWSEIWQQFQVRLKASDRLLVANAGVHLDARDRLLDGRQLQELAETFKSVQLNLESIATSRRQTAIAAVTAGYSVQQIQAQDILRSPQTNVSALADPIYLETTVRSGVEIRHPGTVIILGDVNPGGIIVADGDILIWGRLRGVAHAGAGGNHECMIMALQMEPTQLRIADAVARAPEKSPQQFYPEVAHITDEAIRISRATDFSRSQYLNRIDPDRFNRN